MSFSYPSNFQYQRDGAKQIYVDPVDVAYTFTPIRGDVNNDGKVDITDLVIMCLIYNAKPGYRWNIAKPFDLTMLNGEEVIDIFDVIIISSTYTG